MINNKIMFGIFFVAFITTFHAASAQQNTGTIDVFIKSENNDRVFPQGISIKVFKDLETKPTQEIVSLENNPFSIPSLQLGHRYGVEVYVNSMYAGIGFVDLQKNQQNLEITIKNMGGMRLNVFYEDGQTPLQGAFVAIKSHDGKTWDTSETDQYGNSIRAWLYPSVKDGDYYSAEISLTPDIKYVHSPIKLLPGVAQEFKVVTPWPTIVDKLFTVEVYNSTTTKVTKQDGEFVAQLFDQKKNLVAESTVSDKGLAYFSKLKVNNYALYIKEKDSNGNLQTVAGKSVLITEATNNIKIYLNDPELNSDFINCNCVAFRLDDIQDYYLAPAQIALISLFEEKDLPLTIGVIGGVIGADQTLISAIKTGLASGNIEVASHSWNNKILTKMSKAEQEDLIKNTNSKIKTVFGTQATTFIPPENVFNNDTISVLKNNGFTHFSYDVREAIPPKFKKSDFYHFPILPSTADLDVPTGIWHSVPNDQIMNKIEQSILNYGYAVVMMHPYEFSIYEDGYYSNKVNMTRIQELDSLIEKILSKNLKILPIGSIQDYDVRVVENQPDKPELPNCNCVAFRLDNVQDFWLNDVQNIVMDTFEEKNAPLTISIIGKFIGDDPKVVDHIKTKLDSKTSSLKIANRGWEHIDHTNYDLQNQLASIRQTNDKILRVFGVKPTIFVPPYGAFNNETIGAAKQTGAVYFSASVRSDPPPFESDSLRHVPDTVSFADLSVNDPFLTGTLQQKALTKIQSSLKQYGFAVVSLQPPDLAVKTDQYENDIDTDKLSLLKSLIDDMRSNGITIVTLSRIPTLEEKSLIIPEWIKDNAKWWSEDSITDFDFTKGLEYLIEEGIVKIPSVQTGTGSSKIPDWVKTNAGWWANGQIGNSDFVRGIQYMIENGIIRI